MTKPVQIQPVAWMYTWKEDAGNKFLGPVLKHMREPSGVLTGWDETPLIPAAAARSLLEAKAKEWNDPKSTPKYRKGRINVEEIARTSLKRDVKRGCANELLALAVTIGKTK